ncbi:hypothetical protein AU509_10150 [Lonsdalea britannica]|uniref:DUF2848 domain-containing protein n=1 Tax=Lonsdalea britannica TaxID=1082704 RepID=A0AAD0SFK5_9GAMM|nr:DUF2848 domain-containing protein [Lonsdalea britannica]AXW86954.1 DUF2848 domain-containing protein [Lonsdalea britannica]OSM97052.1 hypothetical protein AU509_10150 [Lonsdalea britannica]OSN04676.1 hypothetical protein AU510_11270 [Lonsdalea britannica]
MKLIFNVLEKSAEKLIEVEIDRLVIAGWTGRDRDAVMHHIRELEALGVPQPSAIPLFYRVATNQLTQSSLVEVVGNASSGEAEPLIFSYHGELYVSLASDHTDRQLEAQNVALSKQLCAKPVAREAWPLREVMAHWDSLILRSWIVEDGEYRLYQEGTLASLQPPMALLQRYLAPDVPMLADGLAMSCGTMTAIGGIRPATEFRMALVDEHLGRTISHSYSSVLLPVVA